MADKKGKVYLVGAGPGDPELFTLKGVAALAKADVVLHDRLVSHELFKHAPASASIIETGKKGYGASTVQTDINELLVKYALAGKTVVRLKGGDVAFFSNILDELQALSQNNIPFEIVPGVTAASGCATYAGIPLTARGYSDEVHIYALHNLEDYDFAPIAKVNGTIVLYMSGAKLLTITEALKSAGMRDRKLVVIEQGTTPFQREFFSTVHNAFEELKGREFNSPALVIIGDVVELSDQFRWYETSGQDGLYFKELTKV